MKCPHCGECQDRVTDSRFDVVDNYIKRRRQCGVCGIRWTTAERIDHTVMPRRRRVRLHAWAKSGKSGLVPQTSL